MEASSIPAHSLLENCREPAKQQELAAAFSALYLPLPEGGEYMQTRRGYLLGLPDYGAVLRIEHNDTEDRAEPPNHPLILQPLASIKGAHYDVELCPGVPQVGVSLSDVLFLEDQIYALGMIAQFTAADDCGYLPMATQKFSHGIPVVIDRTDMFWVDSSYVDTFNEASYAHLGAELIGAQAKLYRPLSQAFKALLAGRQTPLDAWQAMKQGVATGRLFAAWEASRGEKVQKGMDLRTAGNAYARHLQRDAFHAPILKAL